MREKLVRFSTFAFYFKKFIDSQFFRENGREYDAKDPLLKDAKVLASKGLVYNTGGEVTLQSLREQGSGAWTPVGRTVTTNKRHVSHGTSMIKMLDGIHQDSELFKNLVVLRKCPCNKLKFHLQIKTFTDLNDTVFKWYGCVAKFFHEDQGNPLPIMDFGSGSIGDTGEFNKL